MNKKTIQIKKDKKINIVYLTSFFLFILLCVTVFFAIEAAASGATLSELETKVTVLRKENFEINELVVKKSSLTQIQERSQELGFKPADNIFYVSTQQSFAKLP